MIELGLGLFVDVGWVVLSQDLSGQIVGLLTLGFPDESPQPTRRKPLADVVHYDTFGRFSEEASADAGHPPGGLLQTALRRLRFTVGRKRRRR